MFKKMISFAAVVAMLAGMANAAMTDNLVGYWQFENNYLDSTGNNDMLAVWGGASSGPTFGAGQVGSHALELTGWAPAAGNWEYAQTQNPITPAVLGSNARTMNLWFRADLDAIKPIVSYGYSGYPANLGLLFEAITLTTGSLGISKPSWEGHFAGAVGYETAWGVLPIPEVTVGQWHMATLAYDGATNVAVYHDGSHVLDYTTAGALNTTLPASPNDKLFVGASVPLTPSFGYFDGGVDDVALWNRVLTPGEVATIYNRGVQGLGIPEPGTMVLLGLGGIGPLLRRRRRSCLP